MASCLILQQQSAQSLILKNIFNGSKELCVQMEAAAAATNTSRYYFDIAAAAASAASAELVDF